MLRVLMSAGFLALSIGPAQAIEVKWTDWQRSTSDNGFTAFGQLEKLGGGFIDVIYNNPQGVLDLFTGAPGETDYWANTRSRDPATSPFTSTWADTGVDNIPTGTDMVRLRLAGEQSLSFSEPVANPYFAFVSLNGNGYSFLNQDFEILSVAGRNLDGAGPDDSGYWGAGGIERVVVPLGGGEVEYQLNANGIGGIEPHGVIRFQGAFSSLTWESQTSENWNGFTLGIEGEAAVVMPPPPPNGEIPLPPTLILMAAALGGLGAARRRRRAA